jgi:hypothetical protein
MDAYIFLIGTCILFVRIYLVVSMPAGVSEKARLAVMNDLTTSVANPSPTQPNEAMVLSQPCPTTGEITGFLTSTTAITRNSSCR